ncbi:hypothetical protein EYF80_066077 [Liparis tanakae]|uniref:Uncharacterized protein n=1 Tax=Liparis tanakae TaxID=230148 RepID=A0A4Z2E4Y1_9TELE|nr:hypothetical protein EYF80_066077 [Liparis tanakae]
MATRCPGDALNGPGGGALAEIADTLKGWSPGEVVCSVNTSRRAAAVGLRGVNLSPRAPRRAAEGRRRVSGAV